MIKADLKRAEIPYVDEHGRYADFHALRHTFVSNLGKAGVPPKVTQSLARHSDINLTMNVYSHLELEEQFQAVKNLPALPTGKNSGRRGAPNGALWCPKRCPTAVAEARLCCRRMALEPDEDRRSAAQERVALK